MEDNTKFRILIVDDDKTNIDVLNHILKSEYRIIVSKTGKDALRRANDDKPDIILLDILMPDMTGFEVLAELKESNHTRNVPVIFITGLSSVDDEEKGFLLGAVDYITKPFNNSIVKARIRTHLQIVKQMRIIERLGMIDPLTDIANRRSFNNHISIEWGRAVREKLYISLLIIDVDFFKKYNDTYGHPQGDLLLKTIAKLFTACLKRPADLAARVGGEEFAIILPNTDIQGANIIAENIRTDVETVQIPSTGDGPPTSITVSIGVASIQPTAEDKKDDFIKKADSKLYLAKATGRNRVCY